MCAVYTQVKSSPSAPNSNMHLLQLSNATYLRNRTLKLSSFIKCKSTINDYICKYFVHVHRIFTAVSLEYIMWTYNITVFLTYSQNIHRISLCYLDIAQRSDSFIHSSPVLRVSQAHIANYNSQTILHSSLGKALPPPLSLFR